MFRDQSPAVHVPDLVDVRSRIAHHFGYRTEATQVRFHLSMSDSLASVVTLMTEASPRVEYELTPSALALRSVFEEIMRWADEHAGALNLIADEAKQSDKQVRIGRRTSSVRT